MARAEHRRCGAVTTLNIENENGYHFHARYKHIGINTVPASRSLRSLVLLQCVTVDRKKSVHCLLRIKQVISFVTAETRSAARGLGVLRTILNKAMPSENYVIFSSPVSASSRLL